MATVCALLFSSHIRGIRVIRRIKVIKLSCTYCCTDAPRALTVWGIEAENTVDINSNLSCTAEGYPAPEIHWVNALSGEISYSANITMTALGVNQLKCIATNAIRGVQRTSQLIVDVNVTGEMLH